MAYVQAVLEWAVVDGNRFLLMGAFGMALVGLPFVLPLPKTTRR